MNHNDLTVAQLLALEENELAEAARPEIEPGAQLADMKSELEMRIRGLRWRPVRDEVFDQVGGLLDISLGGVLAGAWNKNRELRKQLEKTKTKKGPAFLPLLEHKIKSEQEPYVELLLNEESIGKLVFTVQLELKLKGAQLKIEGGEVRELQGGTVEGKGKVLFQGAVLVDKGLKKWEIPGRLALQDSPRARS